MKRIELLLLLAFVLTSSLHAQPAPPPANPGTVNCIAIRCPDDIRVWTCGQGAIVNYTVLATNHCGPSLLVECNPPSGSFFPTGTTQVDCRARDQAGNTATCSFKVSVVQDVTPPRIVCPPNLTNWVCSPNGGPVTFSVTATDDCDTNVTVICDPPSGSNFPPGVTLVRCVAIDDCGNRDECRFLVVTRVDTEPPRILCPTNIVVWTCDDRGLVVNYTVDAIDDCDTNVTITCEPPSGSLFPLGTHTVKCVAEDDCGRKSECAFQVRVVLDLRPPEIRCPTNIVVFTCRDGERVRYEVEARDDCDTNVTIVCTPPPGSFFPVGTNEVRCVAVDDCGNRDECKFTIIVERERSPRLTIRRAFTHNGFIICWPAPSPGFRLQCTSSLNPPIMWQNVTNTPVLNGSDWCVALRNDARRRFYRLYKPCQPIITDVSHLRPRAGDVLTIKGSGFGFNPHDLCVVIVPNNFNTTNPPPEGEFAAATAGDGTLYIPLRALSADGDSITALMGPVPPDVGSGKLMVGHGIGDEGRPRFQFDDIVLEDPIWVWRKFGPAGMGEQDIEPQPNPDPRERCFFSAAPENGELCVFIQGDWGTNCYVSITARAHDSQNDTGGYDLDGRTVRFIGGGTTRDCVARMAEIIRAAFEQQAGVIVDVAVDEVPPNSGVYKITVRIPGGYIDRGMLTICVRCPDLPQP